MSDGGPMRVALIAGGAGGAKMAHGLALAGTDLTAIVNVADDLEVHGLHVSPDLDTVMYTLGGLANPDTGWGLRDETWSASEMLERYGAETWFRLGDRDLATNVIRTARLDGGATLTEVTAHLVASLGITSLLLPATNDRVRTKVRTDDGWLDFQDYFVRRGHRDDVRELAYNGIESALANPVALEALRVARVVVIAPSNPFLSVAPVLEIGGMADAVRGSRAPVVGVSPIVGGRALRGPADRIFASLGGEASALGVARHYADRYPDLLDGLVIDEEDAAQAAAIEALGIDVLVTGTVMREESDREALAREVLTFAGTLRDAPDG